MKIIDVNNSTDEIDLRQLLEECEGRSVEALRIKTEEELIFLIFDTRNSIEDRPPIIVRNYTNGVYTFTDYDDFEESFRNYVDEESFKKAKISEVKMIFQFTK